MEEFAEDKKTFGDQLIYCSQHMSAHTTGWCTVRVAEKLGLGTNDHNEAVAKYRKFKLQLFTDLKPQII